MKFLTIDYIKQHSRIDFNCEDGVLATYGASAENTLLAYIRRTLDNVRDMNDGVIPPDMYHAALMLTEQAYNHRGPVNPNNMSVVAYGFDLIVKPLMRLDGRTDMQAERDTLLEMMNGYYTEIAVEYMPTDYERHTEEEYEVYDEVVHIIVTTHKKYTGIINPTPLLCAKLRQEVSEIKTKCDELLKTE